MKDPRQRTILECAARLFRHYGPNKTTMADIAREARIGVGTVYLVFPSKEAIVQELSASTHWQVLEAMRTVAKERARYGLSERLGGVLEVRTNTFLTLANEGAHACELMHCETAAVKAAQARFVEEEGELFSELLRDAAERGEVAADMEHDRVSALLQRALTSLSPPWLFSQSPDEARRATFEMSHWLLHGLLARDNTKRAKGR